MSSHNHKTQNVLGLKIRGHDTGAAIIAQGKVFAVSEERLNRIKHARHIFPNLAIKYCLDAAHVVPEDIDLVVIDQVRDRRRYNMEQIFKDESKIKFPNAKIKIINHHLAHAASAFLCSPFKEAAVMIVDGSGERIKTPFGSGLEHTSLYYTKGNDFHLIRKTLRKTGVTAGIGRLYSIITKDVLNLGALNEGKTMGLASYGDAEAIFKYIPRDRWMRNVNGEYYCNPNFVFPGQGGGSFATKGNIKKYITFIIQKLFRRFLPRVPKAAVFFEPINLPEPPRDKNIKLPNEYHNNIAAVVQKLIEEIFLNISRDLSSITRSKNICIAGGCGLNGISNNIILHDGKFDGMFVQPASSDAGIPLGCALWGHHVHFGNERFYVMRDAYLGTLYSEKDIQEAIAEKKEQITYVKSGAVTKETARYLADKKIVGWFQGRSEYGPRSLGSRSILCDPRDGEMKDILNERVKHRENWRPFAASVLKESVSEYFEFPSNIESPFMLFVPKIREEKKKDMRSLVHVDSTCRIQSVTQKENGIFYDLIKEFSRITHVPLVLNTSFNLAGEPIIETPKDALTCFLSTEIDVLVLGDYIIQKKAG